MADADPSEDDVVDQQGELEEQMADDVDSVRSQSGGSDLTKDQAQDGPGSTAGGGVP